MEKFVLKDTSEAQLYEATNVQLLHESTDHYCRIGNSPLSNQRLPNHLWRMVNFRYTECIATRKNIKLRNTVEVNAVLPLRLLYQPDERSFLAFAPQWALCSPTLCGALASFHVQCLREHKHNRNRLQQQTRWARRKCMQAMVNTTLTLCTLYNTEPECTVNHTSVPTPPPSLE